MELWWRFRNYVYGNIRRAFTISFVTEGWVYNLWMDLSSSAALLVLWVTLLSKLPLLPLQVAEESCLTSLDKRISTTLFENIKYHWVAPKPQQRFLIFIMTVESCEEQALSTQLSWCQQALTVLRSLEDWPLQCPLSNQQNTASADVHHVCIEWWLVNANTLLVNEDYW